MSDLWWFLFISFLIGISLLLLPGWEAEKGGSWRPQEGWGWSQEEDDTQQHGLRLQQHPAEGHFFSISPFCCCCYCEACSLWQRRSVIVILLKCFRLNRREARGWLKEKRRRRSWPTGSNPWTSTASVTTNWGGIFAETEDDDILHACKLLQGKFTRKGKFFFFL